MKPIDPETARAALANLHELPADMRELVMAHWMAELVPAVFGNVTGDIAKGPAGLQNDMRSVKTMVKWGGGVAIGLQVVSTFGLSDVLKHFAVVLFGGHV